MISFDWNIPELLLFLLCDSHYISWSGELCLYSTVHTQNSWVMTPSCTQMCPPGRSWTASLTLGCLTGAWITWPCPLMRAGVWPPPFYLVSPYCCYAWCMLLCLLPPSYFAALCYYAVLPFRLNATTFPASSRGLSLFLPLRNSFRPSWLL